MTTTVFGHLALQFSARPENLATEALAYVLRNSSAASRAFVQFLKLAGVEVPEGLAYETQQVGLENSIPDMKCIDSQGVLRVVVENKFWAGLTDNQPVTYMRELPTEVDALLLFVVPEARLRFVWDDLVARSIAADIPVDNVQQHSTITTCEVQGTHRMAVASWRTLLDALAMATISAADINAHNDIVQLQGLCNAMDEQAFLPLRGDELTNLELARRVVNYSDLPFDIVNDAVNRGFCDRRGLRETASRYGSGTYIRMGSYEPWFGYDASAWSRFGISPFWVNFAASYSPVAEIRQKLVSFRTSMPQRCFDFAGQVSVPILLPVGVEKSRVIEYAASQIGELASELGVRAQAASSGN